MSFIPSHTKKYKERSNKLSLIYYYRSWITFTRSPSLRSVTGTLTPSSRSLFKCASTTSGPIEHNRNRQIKLRAYAPYFEWDLKCLSVYLCKERQGSYSYIPAGNSTSLLVLSSGHSLSWVYSHSHSQREYSNSVHAPNLWLVVHFTKEKTVGPIVKTSPKSAYMNCKELDVFTCVWIIGSWSTFTRKDYTSRKGAPTSCRKKEDSQSLLIESSFQKLPIPIYWSVDL